MVELPSLRQMLEAGVHFGHKTSRWHPKMEPYIFIAKSGVHVINLEKTAEKLKEAADFMAKIASEGKTFIFVGTKKQSSVLIEKAAKECGMFFVKERWLGGTLTNFVEIKSATKKFQQEKVDLEENEKNPRIPKSEISKLRKSVAKGDLLLGGLVGMEKQPDALLLFGSHDEINALREAKTSNIPVVALVDTNADPTKVTYPIPANDDATKSVLMFADLFAKIIKENKPKEEIKK